MGCIGHMRLRRRLRRVVRGESGVTLIEFALVLPILTVLFVGLVEFSEAFSITRKLSNAASTVSDLVAQQPSVTTAQLNDIESIADELIKPYSAAPMSIVIVSVVADADNVTTVAWSHPSGAYSVGAAYPLPEEQLTEAFSNLIVAEAEYDFTPTVGSFLGSFTISQRAFFRPRFSGSVAKLD